MTDPFCNVKLDGRPWKAINFSLVSISSSSVKYAKHIVNMLKKKLIDTKPASVDAVIDLFLVFFSSPK